jgi:histidine phosphotransferase ChpT
MIDELQMAELLCTRLCHDLTGPIGAVHNGAEFLAEDGFNLQSQAMELITSSSFSAVSRLQFYRMAYGVVRDHGEASLSDKQKLATDFFAGSKITLDWPESHGDAVGVSVSIKMARLIFNLIIVASGALIRGGTITVRISQDAEGRKQLTVGAEGAGLKWDSEMNKIFGEGLSASELNPKNVQGYLTRRFVDDLQAKLECRVDGEKLAMVVVQ